MGSIEQPQYDAIVVGAGFGGCHVLRTLRERGYRCIVLDNAADLGGVWYWNRYPGARVDSKVPLYEFSDKDVWGDWSWSVKYPGQKEIQDYFQHVEAKLHLKKDIRFNTTVTAAEFDAINHQWHVHTNDKSVFLARYFILCTGSFSKPYIPKFEGLDTFAGQQFHTSAWPHGGIDYKNKRVGIVGSASSGLQTIQEIAPDVKHLTVFQRSPTFAMPMRQTKLTSSNQDKSKYPQIFENRKNNFAGIDRQFNPQSALAVSDEERTKFFEELWEEGGLLFWLGTYQDIIMNKEANKYAYAFWRSKVLPRIKKPEFAEILAPEVPPYFFGTKRATLEQRYYEVYNQDNVDLINTRVNGIKYVVPYGVITEDNAFHELDILVLATGFDSVTGGLLAIDIKGLNGQSLREKWSRGTWTSLGVMTAGFPNMFFTYGPQGPTTFCNGPTCAELQGEWVVSSMDFMREKGHTFLNPDTESERAWREHVNMIGNMTLLPLTESEYMGTNIPGKTKEMLNYLGGLPTYVEKCNELLASGFEGFEIK
ncbi:FAD/NAD(P)-binding domain-containing protein [Cadophora sp. DSE1049]|nr:FAD/NAD(P)-binding domain-containing protein [Cadophora sp. DSE1049]